MRTDWEGVYLDGRTAARQPATIRLMREAIEITPDNVVKLYNIAVGFYERDQYVNAAKAFRVVTDHVADPANDLWRDAMYNRALALKASGNQQEALDCTMKLIEATRATTVSGSTSWTNANRARSSGVKSSVRSKASFQEPDEVRGAFPR